MEDYPLIGTKEKRHSLRVWRSLANGEGRIISKCMLPDIAEEYRRRGYVADFLIVTRYGDILHSEIYEGN